MSRLMVIVLGASLLVATTFCGCGRKLSEEELGEIQTDARDLPGAEEEYELPEPHYTEGERSPEDAP